MKWPHRQSWSMSSSSTVWNSLKRIGVNYLNIWFKGRFHPRSPLVLGFLQGSFFITHSICCYRVCSDFLGLFKSVFIVCFFLQICPFHLDYLIYCYSSYCFLVIFISYYKVDSNGCFFIPDCSNFLLLFVVQPSWRFFSVFKESFQILVSLIFSYYFSVFCFIYFCCNLY